MSATKIEYLNRTWSPIAMRCTPVSAGCDHCWHLAMAKRHAANPSLSKAMREARGGGKPVLLENVLRQPLSWAKPQRIGVQFMGDLFHEDVPTAFIEWVLTTIQQAKQHTFLILTKRPSRCHPKVWTLPPNVWFGVSIEDQRTADERIPILLQIPATVRFVSYEPALGPVEIPHWLGQQARGSMDAGEFTRHDFHGLDWVILGGETGPGARPMNPEWARSVRDQCKAAGVPFWFKGWGQWVPFELGRPGVEPELWSGQNERLTGDIRWYSSLRIAPSGRLAWVNKSELEREYGGEHHRLLDGRAHDGLPEVAMREQRISNGKEAGGEQHQVK